MKILLLGRDGQVGWELQRSLQPLGELIALGRNSSDNADGLCGDLTQLDPLVQTIRNIRPDVIVNAAAYTAVDRAESEPELARAINTLAPGLLAHEAQKLGAWVVHYSTDYVFDGSGQNPWREDDATGPLSVYGRTKLDGEKAVAQCARHLIFRTSWVYGARGGNFAKTMLRLAAQRESLQVIDDQRGAPTGADLLADCTALALHVGLAPGGRSAQAPISGVYHLAAAGETSWFEYANFVFSQVQTAQPAMKLIVKHVKPIPTSAYPTAAKRPLNSRLDTTKVQTTFGLHLPDWRIGVARMLKEMNHE